MKLAERKLAELREKLAGVDADFGHWLAEGGERMPLRKHRTQMLRLTEQLRGIAGRISAELEAVAPDGDEVLRECRRLQLRILEVHRLWDFYRTKLSLRYVQWYQPFLAAADEFAWQVYAPAVGSSAPGSLGREPPLVYLNGEFSPFTHLRDDPFRIEDVPEALDTKEFLQIVTRLPVPVIGLPWYQLAHVPDTVMIAHEVGHAVERDFGLTGTTRQHVLPVFASMPADRRSAWEIWLPEVFADLYGVLSAGPAFVSALADLLAVDPMTVAAESAADAAVRLHPPACVRIALAVEALSHLDFPADAAASWLEVNPAGGPFVADAGALVDGLLHGRYPQFADRLLPDVIAFTPRQHRDAGVAAKSVLRGQIPPTGDVRALVAAARLAFDRDPAGFVASRPGRRSAQELIVDRIAKSVGDKPRSAVREVGQEVAADDRAAGSALYDLMTGLMTGIERGKADG
ncbi:MAG: hypothetical protein ABW215_08860 [Kibdelosporangium sp.]